VLCRVGSTASRVPAIAAPGYVGELGLINSAPRAATIVTAADSRLLRMDAEDFGDDEDFRRATRRAYLAIDKYVRSFLP
jgi:CRP-like cAMP-binding protein